MNMRVYYKVKVLLFLYFISACNTNHENKEQQPGDPLQAIKNYVDNNFDTAAFLKAVCNNYLPHILNGQKDNIIKSEINACLRMAASEHRDKKLLDAIEVVYDNPNNAKYQDAFSTYLITAIKLPVESVVSLLAKGNLSYSLIRDLVEPYLDNEKTLTEANKSTHSNAAFILSSDLYSALAAKPGELDI